ncbi:MAG: hopanoid biosynthesis protein HpnM [Proteobacteria bacterium SG_bin6]|nr:MAG: hopanoid biosynthesis protein HpnM [Proteobacteria bacterium SG_bin6]
MRILFPAVAASLAIAGPAFAQSDPKAPVEALSDGLIAIMKGGGKLGQSGRASQIAGIVDRSFDLPLMARLAVGGAWAEAAPADRAALVAAFRRLTINEYAHNFDSWGGETFRIDPNVDARGGDRLVKTMLVVPRDAPVAIAYRLRENAGQWRIIDVYYKNSISQLTTRRSDFEGIVRTGGVRALVTHVNALADKAAR